MGDRFFDFDAARLERCAETPPPRMRVFGETVDLPRSTPVAVHLAVATYGAEAPLTSKIAVELLGYLVDPETIARWITDHGLEVDDLVTLYLGALAVINERDPAPEAPPPATGEPASDGQTSPSTGATSRPTSPASTASTSAPPSGAT